MVQDKFGVTVTEDRWKEAETAVQAFIRTYPLHWGVFKKELAAQRSEYQLAKDGELKKSGFRNTASFPVVYRRKTELEMEASTGTEDDDGMEEVASLYHILLPILPGLTEQDREGKPNRLYKEFLRRFPIFIPGEKI